MTATMQHITDLGVDEWAALTRRAAVEAVEAAQRHGRTPPTELAAVAAMSERQLVERPEYGQLGRLIRLCVRVSVHGENRNPLLM